MITYGVGLILLAISTVERPNDGVLDPRFAPLPEMQQQGGAGVGPAALPLKQNESSPKNRGAAAKVTLVKNFITVSEAITAIAKQAGMEAVYDIENAELRKNIKVNVVGKPAMEAFSEILKETGLVAKLAADGVTIMIRGAEGKSENLVQGREGTGDITGRVLDSVSKDGIGGVTVIVVGTKLSTVTRDNGSFSINGIPAGGQSLMVKLLGFQSKTVNITVVRGENATTLITLVQASTALSEVVTTATGMQRKIEIGNDIVKINASAILDRSPARSVSDLLRYAQIPGVSVMPASGDPGAPSKIRIRGIGSITQNSDPAVIVDGMWVNSKMSDSSIINQAWGGRKSTDRLVYVSSPLDNLDPANIETIEIVKGPSAASLYGQEAANGVIVITTKKGRPGQASWNYSYSRDWDSQVREKFGNWLPFGRSNSGSTFIGCSIQSHYEMDCIQDSAVNLNRFGFLLDDTGPGRFDAHSGSVRGGSNSINYMFSASTRDNIGTRRTSLVNLIRARRLSIPISDQLKYPGRKQDINISSAIGFTANKYLSLNVLVSANNSRLQKNEMSVNESNQTASYDTTLGFETVSRSVDVIQGGSNEVNINSALRMDLRSGGWWNANGTLGVNLQERKDYSRNDFRSCTGGTCQPSAIQSVQDRLRNSSTNNRVLSGRLSASGTPNTPFINIIKLTPSIGLDVKRDTRRSVMFAMPNVPFGADQGSGVGTGTMTANDIITAGYFLNTTVGLFSRMYFDVGFRQDAGSVIKRNSSSSYPKLSTSWLVSDEKFFPKSPLLNLLRLRAAVGYAAVHPDAADITGGYRYRLAIVDDVLVWIGDFSGVGNNKLVPERSMEVEGGLDADLFGERLQVGLTVANKNLKNAIINRRLPTSSGVGGASRKENISHVQNRSVEFTFNSRLIDNETLLLRVGGGLSNINNVIRKIGNSSVLADNTSKFRIVEGYQVGSVWDRPTLNYSDINNDGYIDASEIAFGDTTVYKGWNTPKFTAAYNGDLSLVKLNIRMSFNVSHQGPRVQYATYHDNYGEIVVGAPVEIQALSRSNTMTQGTAVSVSDWRLMSASISYAVPRSISSKLKSKLIDVSLQGSNLGLWTSYSGRDPMVNSTPVGNAITDDGFVLPVPRKYSIKFRIEL